MKNGGKNKTVALKFLFRVCVHKKVSQSYSSVELVFQREKKLSQFHVNEFIF